MNKNIWIADGINSSAALMKGSPGGIRVLFASKGRNARKQVEAAVALYENGATRESVDKARKASLDARSICEAVTAFLDNEEKKTSA